MAYELSKSNRETLMFFLVIVLTIFRFSYFGFLYTPYLDDYIQYSFYPSYPNPWQSILTGGAGVLFTRPLAGAFDFFVWSRFYPNLGAVALVISVLYGLSGVFFFKALKKCGISVGPVFFAIFLFMPANSEGTYWVSASSRIVVSMFLISAALLSAAEGHTALFFVFNFLSMWFYEQTAALSFFASLLVGIHKKSPKVLVVSVLTAILLAVFYMKFGILGDNADRLELWGISGVFQNALGTAKNFFNVMLGVNFKIATKGFVRGFNLIAEDFSIFWLGILVVLSIGFLNFSQGNGQTFKTAKKQIVVGAILTVVPLIPFFIIQNGSFNLRNIVPCLLGIAILADSLAGTLFKKYAPLVAAVLVFCFSVSTVSEVSDYNLVARRDKELATKIAHQVTSDTKTISVKITSPRYYEQNAQYNDHIMSMTGSDWGITGIVRTISGNRDVVVEIKNDH